MSETGANVKAMDTNLDDIMSDIGRVGKYQIRHFLLSIIPVMLCSMHANNYIFITPDAKYRCLIPECEDVNQSFQPPWILNATEKNDKCYRYALASNASYTSLYNDTVSCRAEQFDQTNKIQCDKYVYELRDTFIEEVGIPCEDWKRALVGTMHSVGTLLGLPIVGLFSDKYGRRAALIISALIEGSVGVIKAFSINYPMFISLDTIEQTFGSGVYTSAYILALELLLPSTRVAGGVAINVFFASGQAMMGLVAWGVPYWRHMVIVLYAPALLLFTYHWMMEESNRYLLSKHRYQEVINNLKKMAKVNGRTLPEKPMESLYFNANNAEQFKINSKIRQKDSEQSKKTEKSPLAQVVRSKILLLRVLKCSVWWITSTFCFYGLSINSSLLPGNMYTNFILSAVVEIPGHIIGLFTMGYFGRKATIFTAFLCGGICLLSFPFIPDDMTWLSLTAYLLGKFFVASAFGCVYLYTSELFPTPLRHSLLAACSMIGRIGSILAPQTPLLALYLPELPSYLFASTCLISAILMLMSPETLGNRLPETIEEAENISSLKVKD